MPLCAVGWGLLIASALLSGAGLVAGLARPQAARLLAWLRLGGLAGAAGALALLTTLVARADPAVAYALQYHASPDSPLGYRLAAVWAGQAGGLMLWGLEAALVSLLIKPGRQPRALAILMGIQAGLLALAGGDNPFSPAQPGARGGLNPALHHPLMLIHPPMIFLGYALLAAPYAVTLAALAERAPGPWPGQVRPWLLAAWLALSAGNGFGALWAYHTFGWGGFWAWDPVENTSLVPWLLAAAALHALRLGRTQAGWLRLAALAAMAAFLAALYGSFLARSGLVAGASVHAYLEQATLFVWALGGLLAAGLLLGAVFLARAGRAWRPSASASRPAPPGLALGTALLLLAAVIVLVGMSLPMLNVVPTLAAYNMVMLPLAIVLLVLLTHAARPPKVGPAGVSAFCLLLGMVFAGSAILLAPGAEAGVMGWRVLQGAGAGALAAAALAAAIAALWPGPRPMSPSRLAHAGLAVLVLGAVISGFGSRSAEVFLPVGEAGLVAGHRIAVLGVPPTRPGLRRVLVGVDGRRGQAEIELDPHFQVELRRACIQSRLWGDLYLVPTVIVPRDVVWRDHHLPAGAMLQLTVKPGMPLVWLGMIMIALGILMAAWRRSPSTHQSPAASSRVPASHSPVRSPVESG